jgi:hypothetical protein
MRRSSLVHSPLVFRLLHARLMPAVARIHRLLVPAAALLALAACGETLASRVTRAMDGCVTARNPAFVGGQGVTALATPLPDSTIELSKKIAYSRGLTGLTAIAEQAPNQVTLVCALEVASYYRNPDVGILLYRYTKHPDAAVGESARRLLETQDPLPAWITRGQ